MFIDVIVPNFDESSDEVIISTWYKKEGDKISSGEVIADVETATVACGITSGYNCFLSKILIKEGQTVSQGSKIAIIETEDEKPSTATSFQEEKALIEEELNNIVTQESDEKPADEIETAREESIAREIEEGVENIEREEQTVMDKMNEEGLGISEEVIESLSQHAEEKFRDILKNTEEKAKEEAIQLREKIIEEAKKQATTQGEELKTKILKEYEEKATKDASAMHEKIIQGSIAEAENTRSQLIEDAKIKAKEEAEALKQDIINTARDEANVESENLKKESLEAAKQQAKENADKMSKNIIEKAISEAKSEAKEIKKDIIHSSKKHAKKEAEQLIKDSLQQAKKEGKQKLAEVLGLAQQEALCIKNKILEDVKHEVKVITDTLLNSVFQESKEEINANLAKLSESSQILENQLMDVRNESLNKAAEIIDKTKEEAIQDANNLKSKVLEEAQKQMKKLLETLLSSVAAETAKEAIKIKDAIISESRAQINSTVSSLITSVTTDALKEATGLKDNLRKRVFSDKEDRCSCDSKDVEENCKSIEEDGTEEPLKENELSKEFVELEENILDNDIVRKLLNIPQEEGEPEMYADNWNKPKFFYSPDDQKENIDFLKKRIAEKMKDTYDSSVISTVSNEVDMSAILSLEKTFGKAFTEKYNTRLGFTPFFIMAAIAALKRYKIFNAHIYDDEIIYKKDYDISVITCGNDGISAPVIRKADLLTLAEIEKTMITLSRRAVEGTLSIEEVSGGTFTVVNAGIYGSLMGTDVLTPPQVATLSVHKMHNRPIATDEGVEVKPMLYVSLSYDHRIADTKLAAEFLSNIKDYVENPGWQLLKL